MSYLTNAVVSGKIFLPIPELPSHVISLGGEVQNIATGHILSVSVNQSGSRCYLQCAVGHVHRLLKAALEGRPLRRDEFVRHINGNTYDNDPTNLAIGTARQNTLDRLAANTYGTKLSNQDVRDIRALAGCRSVKQLAARFGITSIHVRRIVSRRSWAALP